MALRTLTKHIYAYSGAGLNVSQDGSSFTMDLSRSPLNIPTHAVNVYATCVQAGVPPGVESCPILVCSDLVESSVSPNGSPMPVLAMVMDPAKHVDKGPQCHKPGFAFRVRANQALQGENPGFVRFWLMDANGVPVTVPLDEGGWALQVMIEWEQQIEVDYLERDIGETQYY